MLADEYVTSLRERQKSFKPKNQLFLAKNDLVLFYEKNNLDKNSCYVRLLTLYQVKMDKYVEQEVRMPYGSGINWRGDSVKYSDTYLMYIIKHMRTVKLKSYWFSWNFVLKVIRRLFWVQSSEK